MTSEREEQEFFTQSQGIEDLKIGKKNESYSSLLVFSDWSFYDKIGSSRVSCKRIAYFCTWIK